MKSKLIKRLLGILIVALLLYLVDVRELWAALSQLTFSAIAMLAILAVLLIYVSALKWRLFLDALGGSESTLHLFSLYLLGYFVNLLLPSYVGGDAVRSWQIGKKVGQHEALSATILERYTGLVAMVTLGIIFMWFESAVTLEIKLAVVMVACGVVAVTVVSLSAHSLDMLEKIVSLRPVTKHLRKIQGSLHLARKNRALLLKCFALSFLYHSLTVANTMAAAYAVGWSSPPTGELFVVLPLILLVGALPVSPNGLGIQEGAFYYFLHAVGATPAQALGVGVVLRAKSYVLALCGGLVWLSLRQSQNAELELRAPTQKG